MKLFVVCIAICLCLLEPAPADTFAVSNTQDSGTGSLREAVLAANSHPGPDDITFAGVTGVIILTGPLPPVTDALTITGPGASVLTVDGGGAQRILTIAANKVVQLSHLTFANGRQENYENGGAIENHGVLTASHSVFSNNKSYGGFGGAIFNDGTLVLIDTTFSSNRVDGTAGGPGVFGGAVYSAAGSITVRGCTFTGNVAAGGTVMVYNIGESIGAGFGGAIFLADGSGSITFSKFLGNTSVGGSGSPWNGDPFSVDAKGTPGSTGSGALYVKAGSFVTEDSTFTGNFARGGAGGNPAGDGGQARGAAITNVAGNVEVTRCTIASNEALGGSGSGSASTRRGSIGGTGSGGGIASLGGTLTITNSTLSGNKVFGANGKRSFNGTGGGVPGAARGGGVASMAGSIRLTNCTIAANQANPGYVILDVPIPYFVLVGDASGGIYTNSATLSLKSNLFSGNFKHTVYDSGPVVVVNVKDTASDGSGAASSEGHNLFATETGITGLVPSDLRNVAAPLGPLQDNGGPTQTHALPINSPAIHAGDNAGAPATDQRGVERPQGGTVDIGAYEAAAFAILIDGVEVPSGSLIGNSPVTVSLPATFTTGAIYFTLDGTTPTLSSTLYTGPFVLSDSATIRAIAYNSDFTNSVSAGPLNFIRNEQPTFTLPASPVMATATSANGAAVSFTVTASDEEDGPLTPTVVPPSGSTFAVGDTTVQVSAIDSNGAQTSASFTVSVLPQPPEIAVEQPAEDDLTDGGNRAFPLVNVGSTADLNFTIKNVGDSPLALTGTPRVTVESADAGMFAVIAQPAPTIVAGGSTTFTVRFTPTSAGLKLATLHIASDDADENPFDINLTGTGNAGPTLVLPNSPVTVDPTSTSGAVVNFLVTAIDAEDGPLTPMVTPPSGSTFPLGDTTVNVSATDTSGAVTTDSFVVSVRFQRPAGTTVTVSAHSGEAVPGAGTDGLPANAVLKSFGPPAVTDFRALAARVTLSAGSTLLPGIYVEDAAGLGRMAAYKGGSVPGIFSAATTFKKFSEPVMSADGSVAFIATVAGGSVDRTRDTGVWTDAFGSGMQFVLREGSRVPGLLTDAKLQAVSSISLRNGELLALLTLSPARGMVNDGNDTVLLRMTGARNATVLLHEGRALNGFGASKIKSFRVLSPAQGSPGHGRWHSEGTVMAKVTLHDGRTLLVTLAPDGTATPILSTADAATPVSPFAQWKAFGLPAMGSTPTDLGFVLPGATGITGAGFTVAATLKPEIGSVLEENNQVLLYSFDGTAWRVSAREGEMAPVTPAGPRYASFFDPVVNGVADFDVLTTLQAVDGDPAYGIVAYGNIAFLATLQGPGVNASNEVALFSGPSNNPQLVARLGDPAPDESGAATNAVWSKLVNFALPSGPVFLAKTSGGDTNTENSLGLWALDSQRTVRRLLRTGDALTTGGSPITSLKLLNAANGAFGVTRSFNASGSVALVATFADETQALLRVDIP